VAPEPGAAVEHDTDAGLSFADSIPAHERARLNDVFAGEAEQICQPARCIDDCRDNQPTIGLVLEGHARDYQLRWTTAGPHEQPREFESSCELCSLVELEQQITDDLTRVCGELATGQLTLTSDPARARVYVDGQLVGRTPWTIELATGAHDIELDAIGHARRRTTLDIEGGREQQLHLTLAREHANHRGSRRRPQWPAWTTMGIGVALSVAGAALIAVDGNPWTRQCSGDNVDRQGDCRFVLDTRRLGIGLTVVGVGAVSAGVGLAVWARNDGSGRAAGIQLRGRF
jgi:hypothetical protein